MTDFITGLPARLAQLVVAVLTDPLGATAGIVCAAFIILAVVIPTVIIHRERAADRRHARRYR